MTSHEVISAFVDNEPFEPDALKAALADPGGRDLLIDLLALRDLVAPDADSLPTPMSAVPASRPIRWLAAVALVAIAMGAGVAIGHRMSRATVPSAPEATRVIELRPGVEWHETQGGH